MIMDDALNTITNIASQPFDRAAVATDNSILLIYPPERELDFRDLLFDRCLPGLKSLGIPFEILDLSHFLFDCFEEQELEDLQADEFRNYRFMKQGLSKRVESGLCRALQEFSQKSPGTNLFVVSTISLFPLVKFGEVLTNLRDLSCRLLIVFPGEERGGKLHYMNAPDGGNYLALKITLKT